MSQVPTRVLEKSLLSTYPLVAGMDEVGRGALAGPATVGVALVDNSTSDAFPSGLKDSKLLSPTRRQNLVEPVKQWLVDSPSPASQAGPPPGCHYFRWSR